MEKILQRVLSQLMPKKYPRIKDVDVLKYGDDLYRIIYRMNRRASEKLESEITSETIKLLIMMSLEHYDIEIEFL